MVRQPIRLPTLLLLAVLAGCAGPARTPQAEPGEPSAAAASGGLNDRTFRAHLLQAEDTRRVNDVALGGLQSPLPRRRALAARTLGRLADPALLPLIDDEHPDVRVEAVFGAAYAGLPEAVPAILGRAADGSTAVRTAVALALGLYATPELLPAAIEMLRDTDADVRIAACYSIARFRNADSAVHLLIGLTRDGNEAVAGAATYALSRLSGLLDGLSLARRFEVREQLILLAEHESPRIRTNVAEGLFQPVAGPQADTLAKLMASSDEREVLMAVIRATSFPGAPTFVVHEVTLKHADEQVVLATLRGLARMRGDLTNAVLIDFILRDGRPWLQAEAIRSLGSADGRVAVTVANGLSNDPDPVIQAAAAEVLYGRPEPEAAEYARRLWGSSHPWVRYHAIPAMGCVSEPLSEVFSEIFASTSVEEKIQMARAAGYRLGMPERPASDYADAFELLEGLWKVATDREALALQQAVLDNSVVGGHAAGAGVLRLGIASPDGGMRLRAAALLQEHYGESVDAAPIESRPLSFYEQVAEWAERRHAAIVTVFRPGFEPGAFTIALDADRAPMTAWKFAQLAGQGYYDQRRIEEFVPGLRIHAGRGGRDHYTASSTRAEPLVSTFPPGTLAAVAASPDALLGEWMITLNSRPNYLGRYWPFGRVVQFLPGVVGNILPIDRVVAVRMYEGTGSEPVPATR